RGRIECAESDIVRAFLARAHRHVLGGVAAYAYDPLLADYLARIGDAHVLLPEMHTIGIAHDCQIGAIVYDECGLIFTAERRDLLRCRGDFVVMRILES